MYPLFIAAVLGCTTGAAIEVPDSGGTEETVDTGTPGANLNITWRLHEEIESLVVASWDQPVDATGYVEYSFDQGEWEQAPPRALATGPEEELLLGIPYGMDVHIRVVYDEDAGLRSRRVTARTGSIPNAVIVPVPGGESDSARWEQSGKYLLGSINSDEGGWTRGEYWMFIIDRRGRLLWAKEGEERDFTIYLHTSLDGDILWDVCTYWSDFDEGAGSKIHRMKIDGTISDTYEARGMTHSFTELPDRSIVWGSADSESEKVDRRYPDGRTETVWDCRDFYAEVGIDPDVDWCHTNSMFYDPDAGTLLLSFPTDDTFVLEVDAETGEQLRWYGHIPGSYPFGPPDSAARPPRGLPRAPPGSRPVSSHATASSSDGVVREYVEHHDSRSLELIWSYGEGNGIDARFAGEAHRLPGGNTLHNTGTTPRVREITPDGDVVWDMRWSGYRLLGRTIFLEDLYTLAP